MEIKNIRTWESLSRKNEIINLINGENWKITRKKTKIAGAVA
jgi:hypothetical protein